MNLTASQKRVFGTLFFIGLAAGIEKSLIGVLGPLLQDPAYMGSLGLDTFSATQFGLLATPFYLASLIVTFGAGWFVDRFGYAKFIPACLGIMFAGAMFFGLAGYTMGPALLLLLPAARLVIGFGEAGYTNGTPAVVAKNFLQEQRGPIQGKVVATAGLGTIVVYLVFDFIAKEDFRWAYFTLAALFAVALVLFLLFVPDDAKANEKLFEMAPKDSDLHEALIPDESAKEEVKFSEAWGNRNVLVLSAALLLNNLVGVGLLTWSNAMYVRHFPETLAATPWARTFIMVMYGVTVLVAMVVGVDVVKKWFTGREKTFMLMMSVAGAIGLVLTVSMSSLWSSAVLLWISNSFVMMAFAAILVLPYRIIPVRIIGSAFAVINIGALVGGIIQGSLIGAVVDAVGYPWAFTALAVLLLLAGLVPYLLKEPAGTPV